MPRESAGSVVDGPPAGPTLLSRTPGQHPTAPHSALLQTLVARVHQGILERGESFQPEDLPQLRLLVEQASPLSSRDELDTLMAMLNQRLFGLGPLEPLLADEAITEVMVNGPGAVWVERGGAIVASDTSIDQSSLRLIIERIVAPLGLRVDRTMPFVDARLPDGSRVHVAVPPLAVDGPYLTIRKFGTEPFVLTDFASDDVAPLLVRAVVGRVSLVVSGGTGSGKTSLLNALASHIAPGERIITIEDAAELGLGRDHVVRLEARPANAEGVGEVTIRNLVRNALRMRPDRLIVGEVRGPEALDMVQAMNTGHEGSMSTVHANSADEALDRLQTMVMMSDVDLPVALVEKHLRAAIGLIVHVERSEGGARRVASVACWHPDESIELVSNGALTTDGADWRP